MMGTNQALVKMHDTVAGVLTQDDLGYHFVYDKAFLNDPNATAISLILSIQYVQHRNK